MANRSDWPAFHPPPILRNERGAERTVGVEVEFSGLGVEDASALIKELFGGTIERENRFSHRIEGAAFGTWRSEIDSRLLTDEKYKPFLEAIGAGAALTEAIEGALGAVASTWIPCEIATPPVPVTRLAETERVRAALLDRNATGTRASPLYLFGFQLNPELPRLDAPTITAHLRAFLALHDWLAARIDVDVTRRITSVARPFDEAYRARVLDLAYEPDLDTLIGDYLDANPSRERALDMLPLFAHLRPDVVRARADEPDKVNPRPTFHYRLPNSLVDDPAWSFALEWNRWVEVERLAADGPRLARIVDEIGRGSDRRSAEEWYERGRAWELEAA